MEDYILFIDTETSGLPRNWHAPYAQEGNWPYIVQVAWLVYTRTGKLLKAENHYIRNTDFEISRQSGNIHGISPEFLEEKGEDRKAVMELLRKDLLQYTPLLVGHFMQLDYHMLGVGFYRAGVKNPVPSLPAFCTMELTAGFLSDSHKKHLKLGELYQRLFHRLPDRQHDALADAKATAACFFELRKKGDITEKVIREQQERQLFSRKNRGCLLPFLLVLFFMLMMFTQ